MKIVNIVPGFGGTFYCGNCLRDSAFTASLRQVGHEAIVLPMYLPLTISNHHQTSGIPVFYGAVNIFLKQQIPFLRKMPHWLENLLNSGPVLRFAARKSGSTNAQGLEQLTESMLLGKEGYQNEELQQLVDYLKLHEKPDVVHFSNALLLGMAKQIREEVGVPVVFSLQDEDVWIDAMDDNYRDKIWQLMTEKVRDVDAFIAVSDYFARIMQKKLRIPEEKLHVMHVGVDPDAYRYAAPAASPQAIGYLSRICEENGFEVLVDAFILLKKDPLFKALKLNVTGGKTGNDNNFIQKQTEKLKKYHLLADIEIINDFNQDHLESFFRSITVLSVPVLKGEAFGLYQLEALASGIPLVQPHLGAFPEIISATAGGVTYTPNTADALAAKLAEVLGNPAKLSEMSKAGRNAIEEKFDSSKLTGSIVQIYEGVKKSFPTK